MKELMNKISDSSTNKAKKNPKNLEKTKILKRNLFLIANCFL
jgi:hypothetical protein